MSVAADLIRLGLVVVPASDNPNLPAKAPGINAEAPGLTLEQLANREAAGLPDKYHVVIGRTDLGLRSGVADIETDIDKNSGEMIGEASLGAVAAVPDGPYMVSPSGSKHRLVRVEVPEDHEPNIGAGVLGKTSKVDLPWQFLAVDEGRTWHNLDLPIPEAPEALLPHLYKKRAVRPVVEAGEWHGEGFGTEAAVAFLEAYCEKLRLAPAGVWNDTLFKCSRWAGELVAGGTLDPDFARDSILGAMDDIDDLGALKTFESGFGSGLTNPRKLSEDLDPVNILDEIPGNDFSGAVARVSEVLTRPPVEWWPGLEGLLQKGVTSEIVAASGGGKSLWTLQHCVDLAQRGVKVMYCALEGQAGFTGRLKAQIQERRIGGLPETEAALMVAMEDNLLFYNLRIALAGGDVAKSVATLRAVAEHYGSDIVIIDTLIRAAPGVDENDNAQMQGVVDAADLLRYRDGVSVWLIRHAGHDQNRGRGASSVYAALDNSVFISPIGNHDGKDGRPLIVRVRADKVKDGRQAHGLIYRRHELVLGTLPNGDDWTSVVFRPEHDLDEDQNADWTAVLELIDRYDDGLGMTSAQIKAATQWSNTKVGKVLKEMSEASKVQRSKEGKGSFVYTR